MPSLSPRSTRTTRTALLTLASAAAVATATLTAPAASGDTQDAVAASQKLREAGTKEGVFEHLEALQAISDANDKTRASGTPGYRASRGGGLHEDHDHELPSS